jgi:THO complex subunit 2
LTRWYSDKATYDKEAVGPSTPGFLKKWNSNPSEAVYLQYEEFKSVMFKWHKYLTSAFKTCLESRDYMHVRNALAVLEKIINQYPQVDFHGASLDEKVNIIASKEETRGDLQIRAQGYLALLRKSSKTWVSISKFSSLSKSTSSPAASASPSNRPVTPQPSFSTSNMERQQSDRGRSSLNPTAPSFRPQDDHHRYEPFQLKR